MDLRALLDHPLAPRVAGLLILLAALFLVRRLAARAVTAWVSDTETRYRIRKSISIVTWIVTLGVVAVAFDEYIAGVAVALGLAAAAAAFSLQRLIASVAGWVANGFSRWYSLGDRVQIGGTRGDVVDVGILRTTLMEVGEWVGGDQYTGRIVHVPNSALLEVPVHNYSADFEFLWDEIRVPVHRACDAALARGVFERVLEECVGEYGRKAEEQWDRMAARFRVEQATTKPCVYLVVTDNWQEFTLRYVVDYRQRRSTKDRVWTRLLAEFAASGGRLAVASTTTEIIPTHRALETPAPPPAS